VLLPLKDKEVLFVMRRIIRVLMVAAVMATMLAVGALPAFASVPPNGPECGAAYGVHITSAAQTGVLSGELKPGVHHKGFSGVDTSEFC
jgi:hypothetical protein